jgi:putative Ca2+/H+ antiporter (TMEM165/GDT1 family)
MMALSVAFITEILKTVFPKYLSVIITTAFILFAIKRPMKDIIFTNDENTPLGWFVKATKHPFQTMWVFYRPDHRLQREISDIHEKKIILGNIASLKNSDKERDSYTKALRLVHSENCIYFGQIDDKLTLQDQISELKKMNIDYLITWKNTPWGGGKLVYYNFDTRVYSLK